MTPTVVLVHGAFTESASWNGVVELLAARGVPVTAVANPLRGLPGDAAYVRDVVAALGTPVVLAAQSYGGMVATEAATRLPAVAALVYAAAFAPDQGESALGLTAKFPGSTLELALTSCPLSAGGTEHAVRPGAFHHQIAADLPIATAAAMSATQRPITRSALTTGLPSATPAWRSLPSWFVFGDADATIPPALHRFMADRAGAKGVHEIPGASHAVTVSRPAEVTTTILDAVATISG
ncbi:alpha/beta fold hydrolase [Paractinoplanes atraurantiacus]|uniref:Pimeloyl-ACP methyl ester carboxylesterase n=1 Tax=Paractinoplanes atraurantiacus TaxID=1036182 RepID=A0A285KBR8_9ACTN|nr:alpha/beta hydrolase [Actinoplanes atraurantiacus]SNY68876.1 Pimeloyl-ACP methyl ester carboxylesterase [Actinoplanes atraurantiacus]